MFLMVTPYEPTEVGQRLRTLRQAFGVPSGELADLLGVAASAIANWERGRQRPSIAVAEMICRRFGVTLDWLFLGRDETLPLAVHQRLYGRRPEAARPNQG